MPSYLPSEVLITIDGNDVTRYVRPDLTSFDTQMNAGIGSCTITLRDLDQELNLVTGHEIAFSLDSMPQWGGYVSGVRRKFAFPAVDTVTRAPSAVRERVWEIRGVDFNILFDKRVLRNPVDYLHHLPTFSQSSMDGALIREALVDSKYFDIEPEFDVTTEVDDILPPYDALELAPEEFDGSWLEQGSTLRKQIEDFAAISGAVYYFTADKVLHYKPLEEVVARWGFSDFPNYDPIDIGTPGYQDATIGPREIDASQEGGPSTITNDVFIWGGSEWAGGTGQTVFARVTDDDSVDANGRWQKSENHLGEQHYKIQSNVTARGNAIVYGTPDPDVPLTGFALGERFPQWNVSLTWSGHRVPRDGVPDHLVAGQLVNIELQTFAEDAEPLQLLLPLRRLSVSFPAIPEEGDGADPPTWVEFRGSFGLQLSDPASIWRYMLRRGGANAAIRPLAVVDGTAPAAYGSVLTIEPEPATDGSTTVFTLPDGRGYIAGTLELYLSGARLRRGIEFTETDPDVGEFTLTTAPSGSDWLWVVCRIT